MADKKVISNKSLFTLVIVLLLICWLEVLVFWKKIPPQIPWYYSLLWGESQLMNKGGLFLVLGGASILSVATSFISGWTKKEDAVVEKTVLITVVLVCALLLLTLSKVLFIFIT